jgi:hypothetical protein
MANITSRTALHGRASRRRMDNMCRGLLKHPPYRPVFGRKPARPGTPCRESGARVARGLQTPRKGLQPRQETNHFAVNSSYATPSTPPRLSMGPEVW